MRFWIWASVSASLLFFLWLVAHTNFISTIQSYAVSPPLPGHPMPPSPPPSPLDYIRILPEGTTFSGSAIGINGNGDGPPCIGGIQVAEVKKNPSTDSTAALLISGQQRIELERQKLESAKQNDESRDKRTRLYVQAVLTLLLAVACLFLLVNKKTPPAQRAAAIGVFGIALGYWFK